MLILIFYFFREIRNRYLKMLLHYFIFLHQDSEEAEIAFSETNRLIKKIRELARVVENNFAIKDPNYDCYWKHTCEDVILNDTLHRGKETQL